MTNKRKIEILERVIQAFEEIIPKFDEDRYAYSQLERGTCGICDYIVLCVFTDDEWKDFAHQRLLLTDYIQDRFKIEMPETINEHRWELTKEGYQARVRACKKAIERLQNEK